MVLAVIEKIPSRSTEEAQAAEFAVVFYRSCLYDIVLCHDDLDAGVLRRWERILRGGGVRDYSISRYFQAIVEAKRRMRNPDNLAAYLLYRISHGGSLEHLEERARRCIACSAPVDEGRRARMAERIHAGYRLPDVRTPLDCEDFVSTHLTQEEMFEFVGHEVSFSYQEKRIQQLYDDLERAEAESHL